MSLFKQTLWSLFVIVLAAGGWFAFEQRAFFLGDNSAATAATGGNGPATGATRAPGAPRGGPGGQISVVTAPVEIDDSGEGVRAIGTLKAAREVELFPQVTGIVAEITFTPGEKVEAGEILLRLDDEDQQIAVEKAIIARDDARAARDRAERLLKSNNVTNVAVSDAKSAEQRAEIDLRAAQLEFAKRTIRAPFAGTIGLTDISVGDLLGSSRAIAALDDTSTVTVSFEVPERVSSRIAIGQQVTATSESFPGKSVVGEVSAIDSRIDATSRTMRVEARIPNDTGALKPGAAVTIVLTFPGEPRPAVPSLAVQWDRRGPFVWTLDGNVVHRTPIEIVARRSGRVTVVGELKEGTPVVIEGVLRLREGATVVRAGEEAAPPATPRGPGTARLPLPDQGRNAPATGG